MKTKVYLNQGETLAEAEDKLEKALKAKKECAPGEQYCDPAVNEFHEVIEARHKLLMDKIVDDVRIEIQRHVNSKG